MDEVSMAHSSPTPDARPIGVDLLKVLGFGIVLFPIAITLIRRALTFGQRRGTIIEY